MATIEPGLPPRPDAEPDELRDYLTAVLHGSFAAWFLTQPDRFLGGPWDGLVIKTAALAENTAQVILDALARYHHAGTATTAPPHGPADQHETRAA
jgi:hypothetical protein